MSNATTDTIPSGVYTSHDRHGYITAHNVQVEDYGDYVRVGNQAYPRDELILRSGEIRHVGGAWYLN